LALKFVIYLSFSEEITAVKGGHSPMESAKKGEKYESKLDAKQLKFEIRKVHFT